MYPIGSLPLNRLIYFTYVCSWFVVVVYFLLVILFTPYSYLIRTVNVQKWDVYESDTIQRGCYFWLFPIIVV